MRPVLAKQVEMGAKPGVNIWMIGPGSVGKSSVGLRLATSLQYNFVDIDSYFCNQIAPIKDYVERMGVTRVT